MANLYLSGFQKQQIIQALQEAVVLGKYEKLELAPENHIAAYITLRASNGRKILASIHYNGSMNLKLGEYDRNNPSSCREYFFYTQSGWATWTGIGWLRNKTRYRDTHLVFAHLLSILISEIRRKAAEETNNLLAAVDKATALDEVLDEDFLKLEASAAEKCLLSA